MNNAKAWETVVDPNEPARYNDGENLRCPRCGQGLAGMRMNELCPHCGLHAVTIMVAVFNGDLGDAEQLPLIDIQEEPA